jgi:hypothetical protein
MMLRHRIAASICVAFLIGIVVCMERFQGLPFAEYAEDIVQSWSDQVQSGRFNPSYFDRADVDLVVGYLKNKAYLSPQEQALLKELDNELVSRAAKNDLKNRTEALKLLEQELVSLATQEGDLPLDVDYLNSILSSITTYRLATNNPESFGGLHDLVVATLGSLGLKEQELTQKRVSLVPINTLGELGICPLFPRFEDLVVDGEKYRSQLPVFFSKVSTTGKRDWITVELGKAQEGKSIDITQLPCWMDVSQDVGVKGQKVELIQLKSVNQDSLPQTVGACPTLALRNSLKLYDFAMSGDNSFLTKLFDQKDALDFIATYGCIKWANAQQVESFFNTKLIGDVKNSIGFIPSLLLFNREYALRSDPAIIKYVAQLFEKITQGLTQDQFFFTLVVGNEEKAQMGKGFGHYYSLSIIKKDAVTQYIVVDSQVTRYYLFNERSEKMISKELKLYEPVSQPSYELNLLLYFIETLHKGSSNRINIQRDTPLQF